MHIKFTQEMHRFIAFWASSSVLKVPKVPNKMTCCMREASITSAHRMVGGKWLYFKMVNLVQMKL